jgi:hypothetical protein
MSIESIEVRTHELMSMQKIELARALAEREDASIVYTKPVFAHSVSHAMEQGADPEIIDVPAASAEPELLELIPEQPPIDNDHVAGGAEQFPSDVIEGADAAPADEPAKDTAQ